jgi:galactokinase
MAQENENLFKEAKSFFQVFEPKGEIITGVTVPGSALILGEVFEGNLGKVISANLNKNAFIMVQKRKDGDRSLNFYSQHYDEKIRLSLNSPERREENGWAYGMASTLYMLEGTSKKVNGMNIYIDNRIPDLFNANSVEALEAGIADIASQFSDWKLSPLELAQVCADGEKKFLDKDSHFVKYVPMLLGEKGCVTYFDVASGESANIKSDFKGLTFMIMSSGLKKKHTEEKKKAIYAEVKSAIETMNKMGANIASLDTMTPEKFDNYRTKLTLEQRKRCAFFIAENGRVTSANAALVKGDINGFVEIINESQRNIKNRLEIVNEENEILIDTIFDTEGIKAARLLNMGIDGSVLVVIDKDKKTQAEARIKKSFITRTGIDLITEVINIDTEMEDFSINVSSFKK